MQLSAHVILTSCNPASSNTHLRRTPSLLPRPQSKELPALSQSLAELSRKLGRGPSASVSEVDRLLAGQLGLLQQQLAGLAGRLDAREAAELEGQGVATREELQVGAQAIRILQFGSMCSHLQRDMLDRTAATHCAQR